MKNEPKKPNEPLDPEDTRNADPITGEPGSHPVSTGIGATGAGLAGTVIGTAVGGPVGGVIGAIVGGVGGGYAGKAVGEGVNPTEEEAYWRENHSTQPMGSEPFENYAPAYRSGYEGYNRHRDSERAFDAAEEEIRADYEKHGNTVPWEKARGASLSAWERAAARHASPGTRDETGGPITGGNLGQPMPPL